MGTPPLPQMSLKDNGVLQKLRLQSKLSSLQGPFPPLSCTEVDWETSILASDLDEESMHVMEDKNETISEFLVSSLPCFHIGVFNPFTPANPFSA